MISRNEYTVNVGKFLLTFSTLMRSLGEAGQIEPETEGLLVEYAIDFTEFPDEVNIFMISKIKSTQSSHF